MAGEYQHPGSASNPENEITVPNVFGGASFDEDPANILPGLSAHHDEQVPAWEQPNGDDATQQYAGQQYGGQQYGSAGYGTAPQYGGSTDAPYGASGPDYSNATNVGIQGSDGAPSGDAQQLTPLPAERDRRRKALFGVLAVVVLTVAVVLTALLVAPKWSKDNAQPNPTAPTGQTPVESTVASTTSSPPTSSSQPTSLPTSTAPNVLPPPGSTTSRSSTPPVVHTVTVTASTGPSRGTATSSGKPTTSGKPTKSAPPKTTKPAPPKTTKPAPPKTTKPAPPKTTKPTPPKDNLGVPRADIACTNGYIVQLASELDRATFKKRVASLKAQGMVPAGAKAADSKSSCALFSNQTNTWVLYAGPFGSADQGCADRLAGPADAFIKGGNPASSRTYYSCVCPANPASIPAVGPGSNQHGWIGELQRVMANRLNYKIDPLGAAQWGVYTPQTQNAVKKFQTDNHLPATGTVDAASWAAIKAASC